VKAPARQALEEIAKEMDLTLSEVARLALAEFVARRRAS
jgi:hypothetical protein